MSTNLSENSIERSLRLITLFLGLIFLALVPTFCFVASSLCITIVMAVFLAILVEPLVGRLEKLHLGRPLAAGAIVVCGTLLGDSILALRRSQYAHSQVGRVPCQRGSRCYNRRNVVLGMALGGDRVALGGSPHRVCQAHR